MTQTETREAISEVGRMVPQIEVSLRRSAVKSRIVGRMAESLAEVAGMFNWLADYPQETLLIVNLDPRGRIRHFANVATGGRLGFSVAVADVLMPALLTHSSGLILLHNHPEGDPRPSPADIEFTRKIRRACQAMGLTLHEHLVIGWGGLFCRICRHMDAGEAAVLRAA